MAKSDVAVEYFDSGFNCSASVFASFCEDYDVDTEVATMLACGLGGGCGAGEICGAVSGAILVVGLKYGQNIEGDIGTKKNCYAKASQVRDAFKEKNGALTCRDLLADTWELDKEEGKTLRRKLCTGFVKTAAEILEELEY